MLRILVLALMVLAAIPLLLGVLGLAHGSLEMFPTEEQQGKVRIGASLIIGCAALVGGLLWSLLRALRG